MSGLDTGAMGGTPTPPLAEKVKKLKELQPLKENAAVATPYIKCCSPPSGNL